MKMKISLTVTDDISVSECLRILDKMEIRLKLLISHSNNSSPYFQARRSPVVFKFDEHHQACLQQHQRKDSASSEVASFLCISGRTSRISSVGSQGSAASRLSAVSGVSRSPSPHRMLLETSFCGPKPLQGTTDGSVLSSIEPLTAEILEQVILARKHDPTQAVLAEGIQIDTTSSPKPLIKSKQQSQQVKSNISNGDVASTKTNEDVIRKAAPEVRITKPNQPSSMRTLGKKSPGSKETPKKIVGFMPSGTEYIRIKLKPDHLYDDKGIAINERVLDEGNDSQKKPDTLNLGPQKTHKKAAPHFSQLVKSDDIISKHPDQKTIASISASPKPVRHAILARETESRSPSPATISVSRKSSFCTLFKSKENSGSPDSPTAAQKKKSSSSTPDSSRSRSKTRDKEPSSISQNSTPSKQKSVLTIFKPKRSGSKSKSNSPVDPETAASLDGISHISDPHVVNVAQDSRDRSKERLRYYDTPLDGKSVHIPLHTPPEEKEIFKTSNNPSTSSKNTSVSCTSSATARTINSNTSCNSASLTRETLSAYKSKLQETPKSRTVQKLTRIENADGSIIIPLHSPSEERERESTWSMEVQRHSSQESQETVISTQITSQIKDELNNTQPPQVPPVRVTATKQPNLTTETLEPLNAIPDSLNSAVSPVSDTIIPSPKIISPPPPTPANINIAAITPTSTTTATTVTTSTAANKRHILFCTKIGSGSEEQIFTTQLSLSKTESQSSQLSEQTEVPAAIFDSPINNKNGGPAKERKPEEESSEVTSCKNDIIATPPVIMRKKSNEVKRKPRQSTNAEEDDDEVFNRHSRYFENPEEIMEAQKKIEALRNKKRESKRKTEDSGIVGKVIEPPIASKQESITLLNPEKKASIDRTSMVSTDDPGGSSGSERDSEADSTRIKRHLPRNIGTVDEHESTGLVFQESFDDELPYVPTTLPEERSIGIKLVPAKERAQIDVKTFSVERPRSTTPINPASLQNYCGTNVAEESDILISRTDKLRISLPKRSSGSEETSKEKTPSSKSPRRVSNSSGKCWFEFAEQGIGTTTAVTVRKNSMPEDDPPPLPPRKQSQPATPWVNFENIPEKRKPPKRITTLPHKDSSDALDRSGHSMQQYSYVNPEDCQCECHENERDSLKRSTPDPDITSEEAMPLLETESIEGIDRTR